MIRRIAVTNEQTITNADDDGRHEFRSATITAGDDEFVDDKGHEFAHGRVSDRDENDEG